MLIKVRQPHPSPRTIQQVVATLQRGGVVVFPTDTGYAIGCDLFNKKAIDRIYQIKMRDKKKPLSFICSGLGELSQFAVINNRVYRDMRRLLPGPYTFVLPATKVVPKLMISSRSSVGIRVPENSVSQMLVNELRHPIVGSSCTDYKGNPLTDPDEIKKILGKNIDVIVDAGVIPSEPSTVIDFSQNEPVILREGKGKIDSFLIEAE